MPTKLLLPLVTKVLLPRVPPGLIDRPRFTEVLAQAVDKRLILIKASAGFGKTSLALSWAERVQRGGARVAWLALEPDDDEPTRFLYYLAQALQRGCDGVGASALDLISDASLTAPEVVTAALINELAEIEDDTYLFLDDYHYITHPLIHETIAFFMRHAPAQFHLVLITRTEPPLQLARMRVENRLLQIDTATLRFALDETRQFLDREQGGRLDASDVKLLHTTTEGWPAALRIATSAALWQREDITHHVHALSVASRPFAAYLEDMLARLPPEAVQFMSRTAILDHLTAPLCVAVTGVKSSQDLMEFLAGHQLLLVPLDQEGRWYRYHHLLREYLYGRLEARFGAELPKLHRRAYRWFAAQELWADATRHAIAAGDLEPAMTLIENCAMALVKTGELHTLLGWQHQLPSHLMRSQTKLRLAIAWGMALAMRLDEAGALLAGIERDLEGASGPDAEQRILECRTVRAMITTFQDDSEQALSQAETCLQQGPADPWTANVLSNIMRFGYLKAGRLENFYATPWIRYSLDEDRRNVFSSVYRLCFEGLVELYQLRLEPAERCYLEAMRLAETHVGPHSAMAALPAILLAEIRYEQGRTDEAQALIIDRLQAMNAIGMIEHLVRAYLVLARISILDMNFERAHALLDQAETLGHARRSGRIIAMVVLERLRMFVTEGRNLEASACLVRLQRLAEQYPVSTRCAWSEIHDLLALGRAAMAAAENRPGDAAAILERLLAAAHAAHHRHFALRVGAALSVVLMAANEHARAMAVFTDAIHAAVPVGACRTLLDQGQDIGPLLLHFREGDECTARGSPMAPHIDELLASWRALHEPGQRTPAAMRDALSPRERNILELIAGGHTNKEIARTLGIAPETVKSHLKHIFVKLSVAKRTQAVQRAQALGLVKL